MSRINEPNPSHGGTYVVEGRLLLGSDWLVVGLEPCLLFTFIHRRALYQYVVSPRSHVSRASG